nr:hypothetical protein [uncultured Agathobaculum sp.]
MAKHNYKFDRGLPPDGAVALMQKLQEQMQPLVHSANIPASLLAIQERFSRMSQIHENALKVSNLASQVLTNRIYDTITANLQTINDLSGIVATQSIPVDIFDWVPSESLIHSINVTLQSVIEYQEHAESEIDLDIPTDKPLTSEYIKNNILSILGLLFSLISILLYFMPNKDLQTIIEQNQQIIEQNNEQLQLDRERNELLQQLCDTVQAIDDETGILGEQLDSLLEQDDDLEQTMDSPSSDDAADSEQQ